MSHSPFMHFLHFLLNQRSFLMVTTINSLLKRVQQCFLARTFWGQLIINSVIVLPTPITHKQYSLRLLVIRNVFLLQAMLLNAAFDLFPAPQVEQYIVVGYMSIPRL